MNSSSSLAFPFNFKIGSDRVNNLLFNKVQFEIIKEVEIYSSISSISKKDLTG